MIEEANQVKEVLQAAVDESKETALAMKHGAWNGAVPHLQLIHCIADNDEIRWAYLNRNAPKTREQLDGLNSPTCPKSAFEIIADKWNDPTFNPSTRVSNCHPDFQDIADCGYGKVVTLLLADYLGIQNQLLTMRATLLQIIEKWEASGQGDGGR